MRNFLRFCFQRFAKCPFGFHEYEPVLGEDGTYQVCQACGVVEKYNSTVKRFVKL